MKNTKRVVALALALTVGSQAGMSFADEIKDSLIVEKEIVTQEEQVVQEETEQATKGEQAVEEEQEQVTEKEIVEEVYAQDLAGNESKVGSKVVSVGNVNEVVEETVKCGNVNEVKVEKKEIKNDFAQGDFGGFVYNPNNGHTLGDNIVINHNKPFEGTFQISDFDGSFSEMSFTVTSKPDSYKSGLLLNGVVNKDGNMSITSLFSCVKVTDFEFSYNGYCQSDIGINFDFSGSPEGAKYYFWIKNPDGSYALADKSLIVDTKAPIAKKDLALSVAKDGTLMISQDELVDEGCDVYEVYAVVRARVGDLNETIYLDGEEFDENGVWHIPTKFNGTLNLKEHGYDRGTFFVDVYAVDNVGNEGLVSSGQIDYNMTIDSKETVSVSGYGAQESGTAWYKFEDTLRIEAVSESKGEVYQNVQLVINEDPSNYKNKVLTSIELGTDGSINNSNLNHKYFSIVSEKGSVTDSSDSNYDYTNRAVLELKMDRGLYNKDIYVWAIFKGPYAINAQPVKFEGNIKTDYSVPTAIITKESNNYVIKAKDDESGLKSMVAYDSNGLVVSDSHTDGVMTISEDLNPSTVTITDVAGNVRVFNVKTGEGIDGIGSEVMVPPAQGDDYIDLGGDDEEEEVPPAFPPTGGDNTDGFPPIVPDDKPSTPPTGDNNGGNDNNGGPENKPSTPEDKPIVPPAEDGGNDNVTTPDNPSTPDNGEQNPSTPDDKPSVPVNPSEPEEGNKPSNPDNGEINKPVDTDKPNGDGDNKPNDEIIVTPDNGSEDDSSNGTTSNPSTSVDVPRLPQTGEPVSLFAGALGVITSGLGFVLTRRKK